ncbi:hypothetical protein OE88DRAFT_1664830 [Heliocybe sulcata]|uniref:Uncharacterized protein n=1 Tax=Heliocybe sulcata TaxID=5364 RepID=A0A5C3MX44_9AGAM|nr:hypothetical protein OE88DRAFT_1664830 [Heliocybe sulcata]
MSRHLLLPHALMDLTWLRVCSRSELIVSQHPRNFSAFRNGGMKRHMSQAALAQASRSLPMEIDAAPAVNSLHGRRKRTQDKSLVPRSATALSDLEKRVEALQGTVLREETVIDVPSYSEDDLLSIYEDLLAIPSSAQQESIAEAEEAKLSIEEEDRLTIQALSDRLLQPDKSSEISRVRRIVAQIQSVLDKTRAAMETEGEGSGTKKTESPSTVVQMKELESLVRTALLESDPDIAEHALTFKTRIGVRKLLEEDVSDEIVKWYARKGDIQNVERLLKKYIKGIPTDTQRHMHVKAHLVATPAGTLPASALTVLHDYESAGLPAPMKTYTICIFSLLKVGSTTASAQAWDLFAHMRYVAHPNPDAHLYAIMIRACAGSFPSSQAVGRSEPERALDLWTEMTVDRGIEPTLQAYNAVIAALTATGEREYMTEGFRLAKEMMDGGRDARGVPRFLPDEHTFIALLEGVKRMRDLPRVRWILAEMVKATRERGLVLNSDIMRHVFHAYASYRAPFQREETRVVEDRAPTMKKEEIQGVAHRTEEAGPVVLGNDGRFSHIPPQTQAEVLREVDLLFSRITDRNTDASSYNPFGNVEITTKLLNAYLSVYYAHAPLEIIRVAWRTLFALHGLPKNAYTYTEAMERLVYHTSRKKREGAAKIVKEIWLEWREVERQWLEDPKALAVQYVNARMVERMHSAMLRMMTHYGALDDALLHVAAFVQVYPPANLRDMPPLSPLRSTRTVLYAPKPLVRLTSAVDVPDDTVSPLLTFSDLELLHHRLVAARDAEGIKYVKWVAKAYEGSLRRRRAKLMKDTRSRGSSSSVESESAPS